MNMSIVVAAVLTAAPTAAEVGKHQQVTRPDAKRARETSTSLGNTAQPFVSRQYWTAFDWKQCESNPGIGDLPDFPEYDPSKDRVHESRVLKKGQAVVGDGPATVMLLEKDQGAHQYPRGVRIEFRNEDSSPRSCYSVMFLLESQLGTPTVKNDPSTPGEDISFTLLRAQWDIGMSRVNYQCIVFNFPKTQEKSAGVVILHAWHKSEAAQDRPPTWIKCGQKLEVRLASRTEIQDLPDLVLGIDEYDHQLLSRDGSLLAKATFEAGRITFSREDESKRGRDDIVIDRALGQYLETRTRGDSSVKATVRGECSKIDRDSLKF
jgi:hypothetical protein